MAPAVSGEEHHRPSGQFAGEETVGGFAERRCDVDPFLSRQSFDVIKPAAANDANSRVGHGFKWCVGSIPAAGPGKTFSLPALHGPGAGQPNAHSNKRRGSPCACKIML